MTVLRVPKMNAGNSIRMQKHLELAGISCRAFPEDQTMAVNGCSGCVRMARQTLDKLGYASVIMEDF